MGPNWKGHFPNGTLKCTRVWGSYWMAVKYSQEGPWSSLTASLDASVLICKVRGLDHQWFVKYLTLPGRVPSLSGCSSHPPSSKPPETSEPVNTLSNSSLLDPICQDPPAQSVLPRPAALGITSDLVGDGHARAHPSLHWSRSPDDFQAQQNLRSAALTLLFPFLEASSGITLDDSDNSFSSHSMNMTAL